MMAKVIALLLLVLSFESLSSDYSRPEHIEEEVWHKVSPCLIPEEHPAKEMLDRIFAEGRVLASTQTLKRAGFKHVSPRRYTRVIVASHPKLPEYLFKMYTDKQSFHKDQPEWQTWLNRINGAKLIENYIKKKRWNYFTVPKKWMYAVPNPELAQGGKRKDFILVVEKMELLSERKNAEAWKDRDLPKVLLEAFYEVVTYLGLRDCAKPANAPFCKDGTIAFIDTEIFGEWPIEYHKLSMALSRKQKGIWKKLIDKKKVGKLSVP